MAFIGAGKVFRLEFITLIKFFKNTSSTNDRPLRSVFPILDYFVHINL